MKDGITNSSCAVAVPRFDVRTVLTGASAGADAFEALALGCKSGREEIRAGWIDF